MKQIVIREKHPQAALALSRWTELLTERSKHHADWNAIARFMRVQRGGFGLDNAASRTQEKPLSSAPSRALGNLSAAIYGAAANPASSWFALATGDEDLNRWKPMAEWLELATARTYLSFSPSVSNFYDMLEPFVRDLVGFGNAAQFDEIEPRRGKIKDLTVSPNEVCVSVDAFGQVIEAVRRFHLTPVAIIKEYGVDAVPEKLRELAERRDTNLIPVVQHIEENAAYQRGKLGPAGKAWSSTHAIDMGGAWLLRHSGFDDTPARYARWEVESGASYGTGAALVALASVRAHNVMRESTLRGAERAANPTILAPDRDAMPLNGRIVPGGVVYGGTNVRGEALVRAFDALGNVSLTIDQERQVMQEINDALHVTLLNFQNRTGMTPQELAAIEAERSRLFAPNMGRFQTEYLAPKVERRFKMLVKAGQIPPPPDTGRNGEIPLVVRYTSAAALAMQSHGRMMAVQLIGDIAPLAGLKPRLLDRVDEDALIEALAQGAPVKILRSREEADKIAQARAQQEQAMMAMQAAQAGAGVAKDMAQAEAAAQGGGR